MRLDEVREIIENRFGADRDYYSLSVPPKYRKVFNALLKSSSVPFEVDDHGSHLIHGDYKETVSNLINSIR